MPEAPFIVRYVIHVPCFFYLLVCTASSDAREDAAGDGSGAVLPAYAKKFFEREIGNDALAN